MEIEAADAAAAASAVASVGDDIVENWGDVSCLKSLTQLLLILPNYVASPALSLHLASSSLGTINKQSCAGRGHF